MRGGGVRCAPLLFTLAVRGDPRGTMVSYGGNPGSAGAPASQAPQRYPTSQRTFHRIRATVLENSLPVPFKLTLVRNGETATPLSLVVLPESLIGFQDTAYLSTPVMFNDGEGFDVQMLVGPCEGSAKVSVSLE
jgi:hypothetical protein